MKSYREKITVLMPRKDQKKEILAYSRYREISEDRINEFFLKGHKKRYFFPHRAYYLPRCGPDAFKLSHWMCGVNNPDRLIEIILHASESCVDEFPAELFFDDNLVWHQQQFGKPGHIAFAYLVIKDRNLYGLNYVSDIWQRISRLREYKTRIEKKFAGWHHMLLNSIMNLALENNIKKIYSPVADLVMAATDPRRRNRLGRELFDRIYDKTILDFFPARKRSAWWVIDVENNKDKVVVPQKRQHLIEYNKTICVCHDIERGFGHVGSDPEFAARASELAPAALDEMLSIEREAGIKATYNILGCFLGEVKEKIDNGGHCVAFHSYDHKTDAEQLTRCRQADYRIKGYRPPNSIITREIKDQNLAWHNFEWLASWGPSLKIKFPAMQNGIVKIPILFDDFYMYKHKTAYAEWEGAAIDAIKDNYFVAFCLHDCYAQYWLPYYRGFLKKIKELGNFKTINEVANEIILANAL